uniref:Uncharacterized protein n=1 Tax=Avena sativa TaxID=4498 RepID=A0ACD5UF18_AVESA
MEIVTGAMRTLLPKLGDLLIEEYKLQKGLGNEITSLQTELRSMQQALLKVEKVPRDQVDEQTKLWADEVRELSYVIEDAIDKFVFHEGAIEHDVKPPNRIKRLFVLVGDAIKKLKHHHLLGQQIKQIRGALTEVASRRDRNRVDLIPLKPKPIDPRARVLYSDMSGLVGIEGVKDRELIGLLSCGDNAPSGIKLKVVAVVGPGGLGKTTLVRAVYEKLKDDFDISTFVTIG